MNATPYGGVLHGYDRLSVSQLQAAATYAVDRFLGGDTLGLAGEAGFTPGIKNPAPGPG